MSPACVQLRPLPSTPSASYTTGSPRSGAAARQPSPCLLRPPPQPAAPPSLRASIAAAAQPAQRSPRPPQRSPSGAPEGSSPGGQYRGQGCPSLHVAGRTLTLCRPLCNLGHAGPKVLRSAPPSVNSAAPRRSRGHGEAPGQSRDNLRWLLEMAAIGIEVRREPVAACPADGRQLC